MKKFIRKYLKVGLPMMIAAGMAFGISSAFSKKEIHEIPALIRQADLRWAFLSVCFGLLVYLSRAIRWGYLLRATGHTVPFTRLISAVAVTYLSNFFIPRSGEFLRCTALYRTDAVSLDRSLGTVILERLTDLILFILVLGSTFALKWESLYAFLQPVLTNGHSLSWIFFLFLVLLGSAVVLWKILKKRLIYKETYQKIRAFLKGLQQGMASILRMKNKRFFVFHSLLIWIYYYLMTYVMTFAFPGTVRISPSDVLFLMSAGALGILIPASGSIGPYHAAMTGAFVTLGLNKQLGLSFAALIHLSHTALEVVGGLIGLIILSLARNKKRISGRT